MIQYGTHCCIPFTFTYFTYIVTVSCAPGVKVCRLQLPRDEFDSAKEYIVRDDIVPESNYVIVGDDGECIWFPFYGRTVIHHCYSHETG